jgi:hypothetical protein
MALARAIAASLRSAHIVRRLRHDAFRCPRRSWRCAACGALRLAGGTALDLCTAFRKECGLCKSTTLSKGSRSLCACDRTWNSRSHQRSWDRAEQCPWHRVGAGQACQPGTALRAVGPPAPLVVRSVWMHCYEQCRLSRVELIKSAQEVFRVSSARCA